MSTENDPSDLKSEIKENKIEMRVSPFSVNNPSAWFKATEIQFECFAVKSDIRKTGFLLQAVMSQPEVFNKVTDLLETIPDTNRYTYLKDNIIKRLSSSQKERLEMLLEKVELGDKTPSEVLRHMRTLTTGELQVADDIIRSLWLRRLPQSVQIPLVAMEDKTIDELSSIADKIYEVHRTQIMSLNEIKPNLSPARGSNLDQRLEKIENLLSLFSVKNNENNRFRSRSRNRSNSNHNPSGDNSKAKEKPYCYFHWKYGMNARKCKQPCKFETASTVSKDNNQTN